MEDIDCSPASPNSRKRAAPEQDTPSKKPLNLKGTQFVMPTPPGTEESSDASPACSNEQAQRAGSPAPSISTMTSIDDTSIVAATSSNPNDPRNHSTYSFTTQPPPAKKRKVNQAQRLAKEAKDKEKAELKAQKDEQKAKKDEEKRVKDEEKRRKAEEREARRREKDQEEQKKANEKLKKERSQMRLGAFFQQKPATPAKSAAGDGDGAFGLARRKSLSLEPFDAVADQIPKPKSKSPVKGTPQQATPQRQDSPASVAKPIVSDYHRYFLAFELPTHSMIAPAFSISNLNDLACRQGTFDSELKEPSFQETIGLVQPHAVLDYHFATDRASMRGVRMPNIRQLVDQIEGTSRQPIDLTQDAPSQQPLRSLQKVSRRYLEFHEDVRPAWFGTYTKIRSPHTSRKLMLDPFSRSRTDTDYDYDSEAEWDEPEEGEDILADEEDEAESLGDADEMEGFLDDEDDALKNKRKMTTTDLQPVSSGLCWEDHANRLVQSIEGDGTSGTQKEFKGMKLGFLLPGFAGQTIDPFSTAYWANEMAPPAVPITYAPLSTTLGGRPPLQERHNSNGTLSQTTIGAAQGEKGPITTLTAHQGAKRGPKAQPKTLNSEDLEEFKTAVIGSDLGKVELAKALKIRFPKMTHDTIKETLNSRFAVVGPKTDKKWIFVGTV